MARKGYKQAYLSPEAESNYTTLASEIGVVLGKEPTQSDVLEAALYRSVRQTTLIEALIEATAFRLWSRKQGMSGWEEWATAHGDERATYLGHANDLVMQMLREAVPTRPAPAGVWPVGPAGPDTGLDGQESAESATPGAGVPGAH